jgi:hypothetical protein
MAISDISELNDGQDGLFAAIQGVVLDPDGDGG